MTDNSLLSILHISDFHFSKRKQREQGIVVDALIRDLEKICIGHRRPDLVLFTGDLVQAAGVDLHIEAYDFLLDRVSKATGCSDERIFIVPGNHDLSWTGLTDFRDEHNTWRSLLGNATEVDKLNELYYAGAFDEAVTRKFLNYVELERFLGGDERRKARRLSTAFVTVDRIDALNVDIVTFNTAVLSTGGHKDFEPDERKLAVPEYAMIEAAKCLTEGSLRIFLTHHPFGMLTEQSSRYLEGEFAKHAHLHLFGHMHDPQPRNVVGLKGELLSDQAGAVFTARREYYDGYSLITIDRSNGLSETLIRSYFKDRDEFDEGTDIVGGGRWYPSQDARQHFRKIADPVDENAFRAHLAGATLDRLTAEEADVGGDAEVHAKFVSPPLRRTFIQEVSGDDGKVEIETPVAFSDVIGGDANLILYGRAEYGRTTLLKELRYQLLSAAGTLRFPRLPVLMEFSSVGQNVDGMLRAVRGRAELAPQGHDVEALLKLGYVCVMLDDVQFSDIKRMKVLRDFVARYPKARYVLSSPQSSATQFGAHVDPEMPVRFEFVELREFRRNDMRQLLERYGQCTDVEEWLDRLQNEFREINLPFTAANGSILIEILAERHNFTPINRAVLMEQFVDSTLRKAAIEQSRRETFDYTNKTDLLAHIAAWMARKDDYVPSKEMLRIEMKAYVDERGLNVSLDDLLHEFLSSRIFVTKPDDRISFRYRGVLEYFIALRMTSDPAFKEWVMEEDRYLRFVNEIQYYAGKHRNDAALVDLIGGRHEKIIADALSDIGEIDLAQFDTMVLPTDEDDLGVQEVADAIASPPLTKEEKDSELEAEFPKDAEDRQEVFRPLVKESSDRVMLSLILYSGMVKNMELISDADKRRHMKEIWRGWSILLVAALRFAPRLAKERKVRINGALYEVMAPQGIGNVALLKQMMLRLPHVHVRMVSHALGTEKLERQLTEPTLDEGQEPKIFSFFRTGVIADLRLDATPAAITASMGRLRTNHYLLWCSIVHLSELRRLDRVKPDHFKALDAPLATAIANLRGGTAKQRKDEKRRQLARLARDRLMLTMRRERER